MAVRKKKAVELKAAPVTAVSPYSTKKGEKYMNDEQLEHFRTVLLAWKKELEAELEHTLEHMRTDQENPPDPNDRASQETDMSLELRSRDRERKLVKKIDEAIARIDTSDYGFCDACGADIGFDRLEARPTAELCIDCKTVDELREKQQG